MRTALLAWTTVLLVACRQPNPAWLGAAEGDGSTASGPTTGATSVTTTDTADSATSAETTDPTGSATSADPSTTTSPSTSSTTTEPPDGQRMFVSSQSFTGDLGGLAGADSTCAQLANAAGLGGSWSAVLSGDSLDARDRIMVAPPVINTAGETIASDTDSLWGGTLSAAILYDEHGMPTQGLAWTGTTTTGAGSALNCGEFGATNGQGASGDPTATDATWLQQGATGCGSMARIYCIESP